MRHPRFAQLLKLGVFALALLLSATVREVGNHVGSQAVIWLPTGVGIVGVWLLGWPAAGVIAITTIAQRLLLGYDITMGIPAALGSTAEAVTGALILRYFGVRTTFERLQDVVVLFVAAAVAPLASIGFSLVGRMFVWSNPNLPFYSGWDGWWRMNALGTLAVVPAVSPWLTFDQNRITSASVGRMLAVLTTATALLVVALRFAPPGITGVLLLDLVLPVAVLAAMQYGQGGAVVIGTVSGLVVAVATAHGVGPFDSLPLDQRHTALQIYELSVVTLPLLVGALVSERHSALLNALQTRDLLESNARGVSEGLFRLTPDAELPYANGSFARMFGIDELEFGSGQSHPAPPHIVRHLVPLVGDLPDAGTSRELELERSDGSRFWALVSMTPVLDANGHVLYADGVIADISHHKALEAELRQSQKLEAVGKLAGGIAHDFNNTLTAIFAIAESIKDHDAAPPEVSSMADDVLSAARKAAGLTRQLLAYSRQQNLTPQVIDVPAAIDSLSSMLRRVIGEHIPLNVRRSPDALCARVDRGQLEQAVVNLAINAREAMPRRGVLTITTSAAEVAAGQATPSGLEEGRYVAISVQDTGEGMSADVVDKAFDPFFTTRAEGQGTGLGLSTVFGFVKQSGGAVWIDSAPSVGTTVWIYLPRVDAVAAPAPPPLEPEPQPREGTILLVEDEKDVREIVADVLRGVGYKVIEAPNGLDALRVARNIRGPLHLLISDVVMPHLGGPELASRLLNDRPQMKVLLMSGYANDLLEVPGHAGTNASFIPKPFTAAELLARVEKLIDA